MFGGLGRGGGARGGQGFGFRGSSPPWPYVGRGRSGLTRCAYYTRTSAATGAAHAATTMSREEELNYLKNQAQAVKNDLEMINARLRELESGK